ncbi:UNVERIFIED_CONTAM: hypothetical protein Sradi_5832700 [Sesamum radiatum]|uniref:Uncharacterized protein n=1 Tax=Sesamum radiatum TaxID=300843 RepID=A0AAW2KRI3_SESRA
MTQPPLAISKIQSSYERDCHDSSSQRTNSRTIRIGNPNHTDQALRGFHMTIPASHFNQLTTLPTNPLKLHRRPTSPADETRLQYLVQVYRGYSMPNPRSSTWNVPDRPVGVGFIAAKLMRSPSPRVNLSIRGYFVVILKPRSVSVVSTTKHIAILMNSYHIHQSNNI